MPGIFFSLLLREQKESGSTKKEDMEDMMQDWFRNAKLGIFIHYGIYAVGDVSESWSFHNGNISYEDYMKQCEGFTASKFDAKKWAELFQKAGAQYVVMTAKHHDGVAQRFKCREENTGSAGPCKRVYSCHA